jgi:hypothetical protein
VNPSGRLILPNGVNLSYHRHLGIRRRHCHRPAAAARLAGDPRQDPGPGGAPPRRRLRR